METSGGSDSGKSSVTFCGNSDIVNTSHGLSVPALRAVASYQNAAGSAKRILHRQRNFAVPLPRPHLMQDSRPGRVVWGPRHSVPAQKPITRGLSWVRAPFDQAHAVRTLLPGPAKSRHSDHGGARWMSV